MTLSEIEGPISASGLDRNPRNNYIYSSGYDPAPSLTSNYFSIFERASGIFSLNCKNYARAGFEENIQ